LNRHNIAVIGF